MKDFSWSALPLKPESLGTICVKVLTVHEVCVLSGLRVSQFVGGHPQLTDQLSGPDVWSGNVHLHLRVVDLAHQPVSRHLWQVPDQQTAKQHGLQYSSYT